MVDSDRYQYIVNEDSTAQGTVVPLTVTVQHCAGNGARLRVVGLSTLRVPEDQSKYYMGRTVELSIGPRHVAQLIRIAISRGWTPASSGAAFILQITNADVFQANEES